MAWLKEYDQIESTDELKVFTFTKSVTIEAEIDLSELDNEKSCNNAGIGIIQRGNTHIIKPNAAHKNLDKIRGKGRMELYGIQLQNKGVALVYSLYGWTTGETNNITAQRTNDLIQIILQDMNAKPRGPKFILGDFNATPDRLHALRDAIEDQTLFDIGADSMKYGTPNCMPTCQANSKSNKTRRDFIFANYLGKDCVTNFQVCQTQIPTHDILRLCIDNQNKNPKPQREVNMPMSFRSVYDNQCIQKYDENKQNGCYDNNKIDKK